MIGEMKTKPTQNAVRQMQALGIQPDIIIARASVPLDKPRKEKVSLFCNVQARDVISAPDVKTIYDVPGNFERDHLGRRILEKFGLAARRGLSPAWRAMVRRLHGSRRPLKIGIVGKYFGTGDFVLSDSYLSVIEAIKHAAWTQNAKPEISWVNSEQYERDPASVKELKRFDAVIVPGGFGGRGVDGKMAAIRYVREHGIPYLGLCYGMQLAVVEFARNVLGYKAAHTTEIDPGTAHPVISTMAEQQEHIDKGDMGGSMRLGAYDCRLTADSVSRRLYGKSLISERHRHRYEVNNAYRDRLVAKGMRIAGVNPQRNLVEVVELAGHPYFIGTQFHPELKGRPLRPHPLFVGLVRAAIDRSTKK
jgi:CTP synthase